MTWPVVWTVLGERGVREVAQPVINRYVAGELSLEAAARQLATIVRAAVRWKTEHLLPRIVRLDLNVAVNLTATVSLSFGALTLGTMSSSSASLRTALHISPSTFPLAKASSSKEDSVVGAISSCNTDWICRRLTRPYESAEPPREAHI